MCSCVCVTVTVAIVAVGVVAVVVTGVAVAAVVVHALTSLAAVISTIRCDQTKDTGQEFPSLPVAPPLSLQQQQQQQ